MIDTIWTESVYGLAAIGSSGILGGVFGAGVGALLLRGGKLRIAVVAGGVLLGAFVGIGAYPHLAPVVDRGLERWTGGQDFNAPRNVEKTIDAIFTEIAEDPMMAAILEREPEISSSLRDSMRQSLQGAQSGEDVRLKLYERGASMIAGRLMHYIRRGRDADLTVFVGALTSALSDLFDRDPDFCHQYVYRNAELAGRTSAEIRDRIGPEKFDELQAAAALVVREAGERIPDYSRDAGKQIGAAAFDVMRRTLGQNYTGLVMGGRPENVSEAKVACWATVQYYNYMLNSDAPGPAIRHVFMTAR